MKKFLFVVPALFIIVLITGVGLTLNGLREEFLRPTPFDKESILDVPSGFTRTSLKTEDGANVVGWYQIPTNPLAGIVLVHGQGGNKKEMLPFALNLIGKGYGVLLIDLRGHGESSGKRMYFGSREWQEIVSGYDFLKSQESLREKSIGYWGESMGGGAVVSAASLSQKGDFVIATVPVVNYLDALAYGSQSRGFSYIPPTIVKFFLRLAAPLQFGFDYRNAEPALVASALKVPLFVVMAENDQEIGPDQGELLYDLAKGKKDIWVGPGGHNLIFDRSEEVMERIFRFLKTIKTASSSMDGQPQ